ncbi:hypothetical protein C8R48DRAFT_581862, partial [Suillus tomentosus]
HPRRLMTRTRGPYVKVSKEFRALLTHRRHEKRMNEEGEVQAVLCYLEDKAIELARIFKKPRRHYLERFCLGSKLQRAKRGKTSAWSAWVHFKGVRSNTGKYIGRTKMSDIIKDKAEYDELTEDEKKALVAEFDEFKSRAAKRPPNITARTKSTECAKSFQAVRDELEALSQRAGIEAFVFMVRSTSDFQMTPKAFFTSAACEHFMRVYLRRDAARTATDFESAMLSKGIFTSAATNHKNRVIEAKQNIRAGLRASLCEVTKDASATVEFTRYEVAIVRKYHIKLVGWNHPQWANLSDLKGGIEALENVVAAIANNTCRFVEITADEVEERRQKIADGAVLTPETEPRLPPPPTSTLISSPPSQPTPLSSAEHCLPPPPTTLISSPPSQPTPVSSAEP